MVKNYNYDKIWENYVVSKRINGKQVKFGTYKTEEDAQVVVKELSKCNWDKTQLPKILKELDIKSKVGKYV